MDEGKIRRYKSTWRLDDDIVKGLVSRQREKQHQILEDYEKSLNEKKKNRSLN